MSERETPFQEPVTGPEYDVRDQEKSTIFSEYRDDEKLKPAQRKQRGKLRLALIPGIVVIVLLLSFVAGFAFYVQTSHTSFHHVAFSFHGRLPGHQPDQPNQQTQVEPLVQLPLGFMPHITVHNLTGEVTVRGGQINAATIQVNSNGPIDSNALHYTLGSSNSSLTIDIGSSTGSSNASAINLTITIPNNAFLTVVAESSIEVDHVAGEMNLQSERGTITMVALTLQGQSFMQAFGMIQFMGTPGEGSDQFTCINGPVILYIPANSSFHLDIQSHGSRIINSFGKVDTGSTPRADIIISAYNGFIQISPEPTN